MKVAISGKGGVGKTTLSVLLAKEGVSRGYKTILVDCDPDANLAITLGIEDGEIVPLSELRDIIEERVGGGGGGFFKLNPTVDDIPDKFCIHKDGIRLLVMGKINKGGSGCICPQSAFLRSLLLHLLIERNEELVILDMEAGIEHLGRATAQGVDFLIIVVDSDIRSIETARRIKKLASDINLAKVVAVGNKIAGESDESFIASKLPCELRVVGYLPYSDKIKASSVAGAIDYDAEVQDSIIKIFDNLESATT